MPWWVRVGGATNRESGELSAAVMVFDALDEVIALCPIPRRATGLVPGRCRPLPKQAPRADRGGPRARPVTDRTGPDPGPPSDIEDNPAADSWLVGKARSGDLDAFESLVLRHRTRVYRIALRIVGNRDDAQDVTQDVFIQAWTAIAGVLGGSMFTTWLYRITVNRALNHRQRRRDTLPLPDQDTPAPGGPAEEVIARHRAAATARAIAALPPDQRAAFVLHQMEGLSYSEVAAILALPEATIRGRLARARRTLFDALREWV